LVNYLKDRGWITGELALDGGASLAVTSLGFEELEGRRRSNLDSETAFVAMWFDNALDPAWIEGIRPAVKVAGFDPIRIDWDEHNEDVNDRIKAQIRRSRFLVADCTGHRNGVYFEAGFAMGLGLPVVWLCRKDDFNNTHFDTNHYKFILWENPEDIRTALENRIVATIGEGPLRGRARD
jgi:nucleoside 2-deoxyribosyltransferase